jgi:hypothetical protein
MRSRGVHSFFCGHIVAIFIAVIVTLLSSLFICCIFLILFRCYNMFNRNNKRITFFVFFVALLFLFISSSKTKKISTLLFAFVFLKVC